jgi:prefoldin subunit 5
MSFIAELQRLQQSIKELNQTFEALTESVDQYQNTRTTPELPNELVETNKRLNDASPQEWDAVSKRFYQEPKS